MFNKDNFLIVSGNGRNTGKTGFICRVIATLGRKHAITAIKVSPHFHGAGDEVIIAGDHFRISPETDPHKAKDSSRMLAAGAAKVFYAEVQDAHLAEALDALLPLIPAGGPVICESGGLRQLVDPSLFILLRRSGQNTLKEGFRKLTPLAHHIVTFNGSDFDLPPEKIKFDGQRWSCSI